MRIKKGLRFRTKHLFCKRVYEVVKTTTIDKSKFVIYKYKGCKGSFIYQVEEYGFFKKSIEKSVYIIIKYER
jgi:hypothetical protein